MKRAPLYVVLFALFPVLYAGSANGGEISSFGFTVAAIAAVLATAACVALAWCVLGRSWQRAALVVLSLALLFWSYDFLAERVNTIFAAVLPANSQATVDWSLSAACLLIVVLWGWQVRRIEPAKIEPVTTALNVGALALLVMLGLQTITSADESTAAERTAAQQGGGPSGGDAQQPDIYYVILDGYARSDVLQQYYALDNPLIAGLRERGFFVADASTSNYFWTSLSLPSSLNMDYLQPLIGDKLEPQRRNSADVYRLIDDNAATRFLRQRGYRYVHFRSTWGATQMNALADQEIGCEHRLTSDEFLRAMADASWLRVLRSKVGMELAQCHQQQFLTLSRLGRSPGPKFVFAHFLVPHHPYLFDRDGTVLRHVPLSNGMKAQQAMWEDRRSYANQLLYVNQQVLAALDGILKDSRRKPIIIVQSDHGPNLRDGLSFAEQKRVRFANLAAFYLPDAPADLIPRDITPVNEFRYIFNHYFGAQLDILPTKRFYSDYRTPFAFKEEATHAVLTDTGTTHE
jgi:hypothetical protein